MSCELKTLFSVFILSVTAFRLGYSSFSVSSSRGFSYSGEIGFNSVYSSPRLQSGANSILQRFRRAGSKPESLEDSSSGSKDEAPAMRSSSKATYDLQSNDSATMHSINENTALHKGAFDLDEGFQGDDPGVFGKIYQGGSRSPVKRHDLPSIHCSETRMTLITSGREYEHIFVERVDAAPLHLFQVPAYCGYFVRVTWKDLILMVPYNGCYFTQENDSHVLSLLWWGSPIKISCPKTPVMSHPVTSVLCSQFGMVISIEDAQQPAEKHMVKVSGNVQPLLSESCAYPLHSPPEAVLLYTAFDSECVNAANGKNILNVILDGQQFALSCPFPYHLPQFHPYFPSYPFHIPAKPSEQQMPIVPHGPAFPAIPGAFWKPEMPKPAVFPQHPYAQPAVPSVHQQQKPPAYGYTVPFNQPAPPESPVQQHLPPPVDLMAMPSPYPISCPPYPKSFCSQVPIHHQSPYHEPVVTTASQPTVQPVSRTTFPTPTHKPLIPTTRQIPLVPRMVPSSSPEQPRKQSPTLNCTRSKLTAMLPSARMDSIKVKDLKTNAWISITAVPEACRYTLRSVGGNVELSSPIPSCHTKKLSSRVIALSVRFWDSSLLRYRSLQLQCHYIMGTGAQSTIAPVTTKPLPKPVTRLTTISAQTARQPPKFQVLCSSQQMSVDLPPGPTSAIFVQATPDRMKEEAVSIMEAPTHCGYSVNRSENDSINVILPYTSCHMTHKDGQYRIILKYQTQGGRTIESQLSCQASSAQDCAVAPELQLVCGSKALSSSECRGRGCCYSEVTQSCYYPMDECTMDRHFVFAVHASDVDPPLTPSTLVISGNGSCTPQNVTADLALFKIPLDECGVHRYEVGKTIIYMVEIVNRLQQVSLNYGTITRDSPVRLLVECRYLPGSVVSVGYLVKSPSLGPSIKAQGVFGVQLRIAKDEHYKKFYPQYHQPLRLLLGKPLYLEVRLLNPPDPTATLLVHYCIAYPRSANSAWILIYDGCPNFLDQTPTHKPPATPAEALINHVRRFTITTFQFLSEDSLQEDEEIYFMCSTEVCLPSHGPCVEGCFADPSNVKFWEKI